MTKSERFRKEILERYLIFFWGGGHQAHVFEMPTGALVHNMAYFAINFYIPNFDTVHSSFQAFFWYFALRCTSSYPVKAYFLPYVPLGLT